MDQGNDNSSFDKSNSSDTIHKLSKGQIIDFLRNRKTIRFVDLLKITKWRKTSLHNFVRELEFIRLIQTDVIVDENNRSQKIIHLLEVGK